VPRKWKFASACLTWSECVSIYCGIIVTQQRPTAEQSASKFRNLPLRAKERTWANFNLIIACLNKLTTKEPPYVVTPNCLWSVDCQIVSVLTFLTGVFTKLKRGHVKRHAVALSVYGASRSRLCPGPRVHLIRPWLSACGSSTNLPIRRRTLYHWTIAAPKCFYLIYMWT